MHFQAALSVAVFGASALADGKSPTATQHNNTPTYLSKYRAFSTIPITDIPYSPATPPKQLCDVPRGHARVSRLPRRPGLRDQQPERLHRVPPGLLRRGGAGRDADAHGDPAHLQRHGAPPLPHLQQHPQPEQPHGTPPQPHLQQHPRRERQYEPAHRHDGVDHHDGV